MAALRHKDKTDGRMSLADHLRELRRRLVISALAIAAGSVLGWTQYDRLFTAIMAPLREVAAQRHGLVNINFGGITQPFTVQLQMAFFIGIIVASPVWLYQVWGFIVPGLTKREKRTSIAFIAAAVPLFLLGCFLAALAVPRAVEVLLGFTPAGAVNLPDAALYLNFVTRFILAFGNAKKNHGRDAEVKCGATLINQQVDGPAVVARHRLDFTLNLRAGADKERVNEGAYAEARLAHAPPKRFCAP